MGLAGMGRREGEAVGGGKKCNAAVEAPPPSAARCVLDSVTAARTESTTLPFPTTSPCPLLHPPPSPTTGLTTSQGPLNRSLYLTLSHPLTNGAPTLVPNSAATAVQNGAFASPSLAAALSPINAALTSAQVRKSVGRRVREERRRGKGPNQRKEKRRREKTWVFEERREARTVEPERAQVREMVDGNGARGAKTLTASLPLPSPFLPRWSRRSSLHPNRLHLNPLVSGTAL